MALKKQLAQLTFKLTEYMKNLEISKCLLFGLLSLSIASCSDDENEGTGKIEEETGKTGEANEVFTAEEWYPGGVLGTTSTEQGCYANETPAINEQGLNTEFKYGEMFFERSATINGRPFQGLGPAYVRTGCEFCHPNYGHGKRMTRYNLNDYGNGYLLVIYHPKGSTDESGKTYASDTYISEVTGMPQTGAVTPFLPPIEESGINIEWLKATDEHGNKFPDGETYDLIYPEVTIAQTAFNTDPKPNTYKVRLESTIGIQGTGLLDAIDDDSLKTQYEKEAQFASLNPAMWDTATNDWATSAWYTLADGEKRIKKYTYALTRGSLQDGPGANAIWNITNVTRSDRHYLYTTKAWAKAMSETPSVISYIKENAASENSLLHPFYGDGTDENIKELVNKLLGLNAKTDAAEYEKYFLANNEEEMSDDNYYNFMVWHRGMAVPMARDLHDSDVKRGKQLFYEMGCTNCHRPSWTTGNDNYWACSVVKGQGKLPVYANQKIWPYTDMIQHRLYMENDIRGEWCRTTPLWGRGLSAQETGAEDRLHDCRARNEIEAIMWHGYSPKSDAYESAQKFYNLSKEDRNAVVKFLRAI